MAAIQTYQRITIPTHWVAFALSLALHALMLWGWVPAPRALPFEESKEGRPSGSIAIRIAPEPKPPAPPPAPESRPQPAPAPVPKVPTPKAAAKPAPKPKAPEILAMQRGASRAPAPSPAPANDFAAFVEARRRARESSEAQRPPSPPAPPAQQPVESEEARQERIRAMNLGLDRAPGTGSSRERGGGIFQVARVTSDEAEFFFYGWNKDIQRNSPQMISVRRGNNASIELAVVRRMVELIRERSSGDFTFESKRLGRDVQLSARLADGAKLEEFLMREFFSVRQGPR